MRIYDVTLPIRRGMVTFPGDPAFSVEPVTHRLKGDLFDSAVMVLGTHTGTHVDAPAHYLDGGVTVDRIPADDLVGPGIVLDMRGRPCIDRHALETSELGDYKRVFFKTDNSLKLLESGFSEDYVHLTRTGAEYLVKRDVKLAGIDYLSIEAFHSPEALVHKTLLGAGIVVTEGLMLVDVPAGPCTIYCLPLKIEGADGAPARVLISV